MPLSASTSDTDEACENMPAHAANRRSSKVDLSRALASAFVGMVAIGHCQYTWTLFVPFLQRSLQSSQAVVQGGFSCFVLFQTGSVLLSGLLITRKLHRHAMAFGGAALLVALRGLASASSVSELYAYASLMGAGVGCTYNVCMSVSVSVVQAHRGLAAGVIAAGYGAGTLPTIGYIKHQLDSLGHTVALRTLANALSATVLVCALAMPRAAQSSNPAVSTSRTSGPQVVAKGQQLRLVAAMRLQSFWVLYVMLILIATIGLIVAAQLSQVASMYSIPSASLLAALQLDRVLNGASRPLWGLVSDQIGRENALGLAFSIQAVALLAWSQMLADPRAFVLLSAVSTFGWGEIYSLFPALAADLFGTEHVSETYGFLYTGKFVASLLAGPVASMVAAVFRWDVIFVIMGVAAAVDAWLALVVLKQLTKGITQPTNQDTQHCPLS